MEALRYLLAACFFGLAAGAFLLFGNDAGRITVTEARLTPMGDSFALTIAIDNPGGPDKLLGIGSEAASNVMLMGAGERLELAIPAQSTPALAMDGAHAMITNIVGDGGEGRLLPITLWFERSGGVETRARISGDDLMAHGAGFEVPDDALKPEVRIMAQPEGKDWVIRIEATNFQFNKDAVDKAHQSGSGHGHLYLNGLKLQRVYSDEVRVGALPPGHHIFSVTLNTNDHQTYFVDGLPVTASITVLSD